MSERQYDTFVLYHSETDERRVILRQKKMSGLAMRTKRCAKSVNMLKHLPAIALEEHLNQSIKPISAAR